MVAYALTLVIWRHTASRVPVLVLCTNLCQPNSLVVLNVNFAVFKSAKTTNWIQLKTCHCEAIFFATYHAVLTYICNAISNVVAACRIVHKFTWLKFNSCCHPHACMLSLKRWIIGNFMKYMLVANRTWSFFMLPLHRRIGNKQKRSLESQPFKLMSLCTRDGLYQLFKSIRYRYDTKDF